MHIPKTGGTTLCHIIRKNYPPRKESWYLKKLFSRIEGLTKEEIANINCVYGHFPFGVHDYFLRPFTYITLIRDPIEQAISAYYFILRNPDVHAYEEVKKMSFEEFVIHFPRKTSNRQTRYASGGKQPDLNQAKENLRKHFSIVGITERFDESLFVMKKEFGWLNINYEKHNVTFNRPTKDQLPTRVLNLIKENNQLDLELYQFANEVLEQKIQSFDAKSREELNEFISMQKGL